MKQKENIVLLVLGIVLILLGGVLGWIIGRGLKECPTITTTITKFDTVYQGYPIIDAQKIKVPVNNTVFVDRIREKKTILHDTFYKEYPSFVSDDTLHSDNNEMYVALKDTGNCTGILSRGYVFGGELKERVITKTITNNVVKPFPLITIFAGVSGSFSNKWNAFDIAPTVSINLRNRYNIGYQYGLNTSTHNFSLQTKIK